ncbi:TonB-dependent receptor domain-containing protein [Brevundimonas nasdae]|uniref:TonB-dependent receptor n=1 Tax=Brevundimonas nasdae TaxID=172043 RepID=UPI003F693B18
MTKARHNIGAMRLFLMATTAVASAAVLAPLPAAAQTQPSFDVPAGPLTPALIRFAQQANVELAYDASLTRNASTRGLQGRYSVSDGLSRLLAGSGVTYSLSGRIVTLSAAPSVGNAIALGPVRVQGATEGGAGRLSADGFDTHGDPVEAPYRSAGSSAYIDHDTIERFRGTSTADVIKGVAGVTAGDPRTANALDVNIRGIQGQSRVPVIIDGGQSTMDTYRGYAGQSQRTYLDPDLISNITITKGPSLQANASGGIGGVVVMETLKADDVLTEGHDLGLRVRTGVSDASARRLPAYSGVPSKDSGDLTRPGGQFFNIAAAGRWDRFDLVAAYAWRDVGNYFSGHRGYNDFPQGRRVLATLNPTNTEVFNTSSQSESLLLKGTWRITDEQTLEAGYRRYKGEQGEIMASQIIRVDRDRVPQWALGNVDMDAYNLRYRYKPQGKLGDLVDLRANAWYTHSDSLMYNGLTGITPWYYDRRTDWWDAPSFNTDPGYKDAYRNELTQERFGGDITNTSLLFTDLGKFTFDYGLSFSHEDVGPGPNSPLMQDDLVNNRFLRSAVRKEYSVVASAKWEQDEHWELMVGGRYNHVDVRDRNRLATVSKRETIGKYRSIQLLSGDASLPAWRATRIASLNWYPDANGQFTQASLLASPYKRGTAADITGWNFYDAGAISDLIVPTEWTWSDPIRRTDDAFMPTASVTYRFDEDTLLYVKYAEGVKLPSLFETTLGLFTAAKPVGELKPERAKTWEVGASTIRRDLITGGDRAGFKLAYFNTRIDDLITRDYRTLSAGLIRNIDQFKVSGVEFQFSYDNGVVFGDLSAHYYFEAKTCAPDIAAERREYGEEWDIDGLKNTPSCVDGGFEGSYTNTQNPPRYNINLTLGARLFDDRLTIGGRAVHNAGPISKLDQEWNVGLSAIQQLYKEATIYDAFASLKVTEQTKLDLNIDNVMDEYYLDPLALGVMPAPGRTVRLALTYRY